MSESRWDHPTAGMDHRPTGGSPSWVDAELLSGADDDICLRIGDPVHQG